MQFVQNEIAKEREARGISYGDFHAYRNLHREMSAKYLKDELDLDPSKAYTTEIPSNTSTICNLIKKAKKGETKFDTLLDKATTSKVHSEVTEQQNDR